MSDGSDVVRPRPRSLVALGDALGDPREQRRRLARVPLARTFDEAVREVVPEGLRASAIRVMQLNLGRVCNQVCRHCHVDAAPDRRESMGDEVVHASLAWLERSDIPIVDVTGGAPELHPAFRRIVERARALGRTVFVRCNLTVLETAPCHDLPSFFSEHRVEVVASLPHYRAPNTDAQRGEGVFEKSIRALRRLNEVGYGTGDPARRLSLVTNPVGAFLPAQQGSLEREWKRELESRHGVRFDALLALANMPVGRFLAWLDEKTLLDGYVGRLEQAFNPASVPRLMCRDTVSIGWDGRLFDCDFNQMLDLPSEGAPTVFDVLASGFSERPIVTHAHCYGCTAGQGSSCGGAIAD